MKPTDIKFIHLKGDEYELNDVVFLNAMDTIKEASEGMMDAANHFEKAHLEVSKDVPKRNTIPAGSVANSLGDDSFDDESDTDSDEALPEAPDAILETEGSKESKTTTEMELPTVSGRETLVNTSKYARDVLKAMAFNISSISQSFLTKLDMLSEDVERFAVKCLKVFLIYGTSYTRTFFAA